jgi:putative ABC transport system permease protein
MDALIHQVRVASRSLIRAPHFAAAAMLTLALGIGLSTAVFTVADALLIRALPVADQDRVLLLWGEARGGQLSKIPLTLNDVRDFERRSQSLAHVAFFAFRGAVPAPIRVDGRAIPIRIGLVSGNYFGVLGSRPALGRALRPEDDIAGATPVVVISYRAWQKLFRGDSAIIGKSVRMIYTGRSYTIVGVMPKGLDYPRGTDVWAPLIAYGAAGGFLDILSGELDVVARLKPGATARQASGELTAYFDRPNAPASQRDVRGVASPLADVMLGSTKPAVVLVALAAALLFLLTCVNVANLLLVRSLGRVKDVAVQSALGASRGRIVTQLITESGLLAMGGGLLGTAFAAAAVKLFVGLAPSSVPRIDEIGVSWGMLAPALVITVVAMLLSVLGPAVFTLRVQESEVLRSGSRSSGGRRIRRAAEVLVVVQIILATVGLVAAGLVIRSFINLENVDLGFEPGHLVVVQMAMQPDQLADQQRQQRAIDMAVANAKALPGVRDVTPVFAVPFVGEGGGVDGRVSTPGQSEEEQAQNPVVNMDVAAPNYFAMLGIPVLRGRSITDKDDKGSEPVVVISTSVARHFWSSADPIGRQLSISKHNFTVVGVVPDTRYRELQTPWPSVYFASTQSPLGVPSTLLIRTSVLADAVVPAVRRTVSDVPGLIVLGASSLETPLDVARAQPQLNAMVLALFAIAAITLAAVGLLAVIATMVRQRTHEFGIRMALGATSGRVRRMIMVRGISLAAAGIAIGIAVALAVSRLLSALVFAISPTDPPTVVGVAVLMLGVATIATFIPAWLSMRVDPVIALRSEC